MIKNSIALLAACLFCVSINAQNSFGFRTGMNYNTNLTDNLEDGEAFDYTSGFHIGFSFSRNFTDIWGARAEFLYNQKGTRNSFNGASYLTLERGDRRITHTGMRTTEITVTNSHIDFPITVFGRIANWIEVSAGVAPSLLVYSRGRGDLSFSSDALNSDVSLTLDHNYYSDRVGEVGEEAETITVKERATANDLTVPSSVGAFYFSEEGNDVNPYNFFTLDAVAGINIFVNRGLYISARVQYGLLDSTKNSADFSQAEQNVTRDDKDNSLIFQGSVGFNF